MSEYSYETYRAATEFLLGLQAYDPENPWGETGIAKNPDDFDALSILLRKTLESANKAIDRDQAYSCFQIPKGKGKFRSIEAPDGKGATQNINSEETRENMEIVQSEKEKRVERIAAGDFFEVDRFASVRAILAPGFNVPESMNIVRTAQKTVGNILSSRLLFGSEVCGFRHDSGTYDGLRRILEPFYHRKVERIASVYQIDIRNFFPSVTESMASEGLARIFTLMKPTLGADVETIENTARLLAKTGCYKWRLAQGGHLSPLLANSAAQLLIDQDILALIKTYRRNLGASDATFSYGRYADDIVILSSQPMSEELRKEIDAIVSKHFVIAEEKRLYQEGKSHYLIWGASLQADRQFERVRFGSDKKIQGNCIGTGRVPANPLAYTDFGFKLPKKIERRIVAATYECLSKIQSPSGARELQDGSSELAKNFRELVGYFSHAYNISRSGGVITLAKDGEYYGLPKPLCFVWQKLKAISQEIISPDIFQNTFIIQKEADFEANKKLAVRHRELASEHEAKFLSLKTTLKDAWKNNPSSETITSSSEEIREWLADLERAERESGCDIFGDSV